MQLRNVRTFVAVASTPGLELAFCQAAATWMAGTIGERPAFADVLRTAKAGHDDDY